MSLKNWELVLYLSIVVFVLCQILLIIRKHIKNRYYHEFKQDELIKTTKTSNSINKLYFTHGVTMQFIRKYVLCKTPNDKYVIVNYAKPYKTIGYYVVCYNSKRKVIQVIKLEETYTTLASSVISVKNNTQYVNVVVGHVEDRVYNKNLIQPLKLNKIREYALIKSVSMFSLFMILRHAVGYIFASSFYFTQFLNSPYNILSIVIMAIICALTGIIRTLVLRKRNVKASKGGVIEYEFI